jgi:hypothetical protein
LKIQATGLTFSFLFGSTAHTTAHRKNDFDTTNYIHLINVSDHFMQPQMSIVLWMKPDLKSIDNSANTELPKDFPK